MSKGLLGTRTKVGGAEAKRLDLIMAANVQTALATKVQELSGVFRKKQTAYLRREQTLDSPMCAADEVATELKGHDGKGQDSYATTSANTDPLASLFADEQYVRHLHCTAVLLLTRRCQ